MKQLFKMSFIFLLLAPMLVAFVIAMPAFAGSKSINDVIISDDVLKGLEALEADLAKDLANPDGSFNSPNWTAMVSETEEEEVIRVAMYEEINRSRTSNDANSECAINDEIPNVTAANTGNYIIDEIPNVTANTANWLRANSLNHIAPADAISALDHLIHSGILTVRTLSYRALEVSAGMNVSMAVVNYDNDVINTRQLAPMLV